jgi:hypothetical protein
MNQIILLLILSGLLSCQNQKQYNLQKPLIEIRKRTTLLTQKEIEILDSVNTNSQVMAGCEAYSSEKNKIKSNGESHSDNLPFKIDKSFSRQGLYLFINSKEFSKGDRSVLCSKLYLVNTTDSLVKLKASDSRLYIFTEALNDKNMWAPISYFPSSTCGNSNHIVILDKDEYWNFDVPVFKGKTKTKIRYTLQMNEEQKISSNEIDAFINKGQFEKSKTF